MRTNTNKPYSTVPSYITTITRKHTHTGTCYQAGKASELEGETETPVSFGQSKTRRPTESSFFSHIIQDEDMESQCQHKGVCAIQFV
jgi:hypothetical protein